MKKFLAILLIFMLLITGCGDKKEENDKEKKINCPDGVVEKGKCKVKTEEHEATVEATCKENYELIEGICILKEITEPISDYSCEGDLTLEGTTCNGKDVKNPTYSCEIGTLSVKKCIKKTLVGDAAVSCETYPDPKIYRNGNCYLGLPLTGEGCEAGDTLEDGWCYNFNNPKVPSYTCAVGKLDNKKCYEVLEMDAEAKCDEGYNLENDKCIKEIKGVEAKETLLCDTDYKLEEDKCTKITNREAPVDASVCKEEGFVLEGDKCVKYEYK